MSGPIALYATFVLVSEKFGKPGAFARSEARSALLYSHAIRLNERACLRNVRRRGRGGGTRAGTGASSVCLPSLNVQTAGESPGISFPLPGSGTFPDNIPFFFSQPPAPTPPPPPNHPPPPPSKPLNYHR